MSNRKKTVIVSLWMHSCAGRRHLAGVFRYIARGCDWDVRLCRRGELTKDLLSGTDGVITSPHIEKELLHLIQIRRIPLVTIDIEESALKTTSRVGRICSDDYAVGAAMAQHILSYGNFRSFGFFYDVGSGWALRRHKGFVEGLATRKRTVNTLTLDWNQDKSARSAALSDWLRGLDKPAAVMTSTDTLALEVISAARRAKIRIPHDVAVVGTDDDELLCEYAKPRLTSIRPGHEVCGYAAAEELDRIFRGKEPRTRYIPFETITDRKSLAVCIPATHLIEAAKDHIDKHACEGIGVDDVARALGVSRRLLSLRFAECEGRSVHAALVERRLSEVMRSLRQSQLPISEITARCGFPNANYLKHLFKRRTGKTMREWRCRDSAADGRSGKGTRRD